MPTSSSPSELPTCRCGHDRTHHFARAKTRNGFWGWILLFNGASATPKEIEFTCGRCGELIERSTDPEVNRAYINH